MVLYYISQVPSNLPSNQSSSDTKVYDQFSSSLSVRVYCSVMVISYRLISLLYVLSFQEKEGSSSSSCDMISFDLSNGDPYPPNLAVALDDDQYVEFQVEDLPDFPSTAEEEERVIIPFGPSF